MKGTNWKAISTTVDGRKIEGEYAVSGHLVKVRHEDRERGGDLGDSDPETKEATPRAGRGRACLAGREVAACGFKFGSPAGSALVGCEMAGGSEEGNESSSVLSSSLSRSLFLFRAACPAPRSSRCKSSLCLLREILPPQCFAILVSPVCGKNAWPRASVPTVERFADDDVSR